MSNNESFIEEVTEEVRRDRLFALMRRYGWIGVLVVLLLVGGAAYNEWRKASDKAAAEKLGASLMAALEHDDPAARVAALGEIDGVGSAQAVVALLTAAEELGADDRPAAAASLTTISNDASLPKAFRDLAALKLVLLQGADMAVDERRALLATLAVAGAPFRLLAEEQLAMIEIETGENSAAILRLQAIMADVEVTAGLRNRASQLIVVLGGEIEAS